MPPWKHGPSLGNPFPEECCCHPQPDDGYYDLYEEGGAGGCECCGGATRTVTITATDGDQPLIGPPPANGTLCTTYGPDGARGPRWSELVGLEIVMNNISAMFPGEAENMCKTFDTTAIIEPFDQLHTLTTQSVRYSGSTTVNLNVQRFWSENGVDQCPDCVATFDVFASYRCESVKDHTAGGQEWRRHELWIFVTATEETQDCYSPLSDYQSQGHWFCEDTGPYFSQIGGPWTACGGECLKLGWVGDFPAGSIYRVTQVNVEKP